MLEVLKRNLGFSRSVGGFCGLSPWFLLLVECPPERGRSVDVILMCSPPGLFYWSLVFVFGWVFLGVRLCCQWQELGHGSNSVGAWRCVGWQRG